MLLPFPSILQGPCFKDRVSSVNPLDEEKHSSYRPVDIYKGTQEQVPAPHKCISCETEGL